MGMPLFGPKVYSMPQRVGPGIEFPNNINKPFGLDFRPQYFVFLAYECEYSRSEIEACRKWKCFRTVCATKQLFEVNFFGKRVDGLF